HELRGRRGGAEDAEDRTRAKAVGRCRRNEIARAAALHFVAGGERGQELLTGAAFALGRRQAGGNDEHARMRQHVVRVARVVHQGLRLVDDGGWQRLEGERGDEVSERDSERGPLHGASSTCRRAWSIMRPMKPREERIRVGGIDVHTWIGGDGAPLLVLHGAGGNRGFTRWAERVAQRFTVWAPTHPGFGLSGDAEWMDGIDDLARFYLWFMDVAGLVRPHVLGHSIGGWTAAEMATMSPGLIDCLILGAPAGLQ